MRYKTKEWREVAVIMRENSYIILEGLSKQDMRWTELKSLANLTDSGLQKILKELTEMNIIEQIAEKTSEGKWEKRYTISKKARKYKIFEKTEELRKDLKRVAR